VGARFEPNGKNTKRKQGKGENKKVVGGVKNGSFPGLGGLVRALLGTRDEKNGSMASVQWEEDKHRVQTGQFLSQKTSKRGLDQLQKAKQTKEKKN